MKYLLDFTRFSIGPFLLKYFALVNCSVCLLWYSFCSSPHQLPINSIATV
jgi:hypothetical protein